LFGTASADGGGGVTRVVVEVDESFESAPSVSD
jgi:hypothetical protein